MKNRNNRLLIYLPLVVIFLLLSNVGLNAQDYQIGAYYFPNFHVDSRNAPYHGEGWTEWQIVKHATPRFRGHRQPKVPLWGYEDESDSKVMEKKIEVANKYGIDFFIFDWYYYQNEEYLNRALDEGYFGAQNNQKVPFSLMWANHHWRNLFPTKYGGASRIWSAHVSGEAFDKMTDLIIGKYFKHPSYYKINGAPYFSIFHIKTFINAFETEYHAVQALKRFRQKTIEAGFPDLHLNVIARNYKPTEFKGKVVQYYNDLIERMSFNSITTYNMITVKEGKEEEFPRLEYKTVLDSADKFWENIYGKFTQPYYPTISMGWDTSPRTVQSDIYEYRGYPFNYIWVNNTPELFKEGLRRMKEYMDNHGRKIGLINAWNEWPEGSYLEPDTTYGYQYLEAVREVFGSR